MNPSKLALALIAVVLLPSALALPALGAWTPAAFPTYSRCQVTVRDLAFVTPVTGVAVGNCSTVAVTTDAGASWKRVNRFGDLNEMHGADAAADGTMVAVGKNAIFQPFVAYSRDGGASWDASVFYFWDPPGHGHEATLRDVAILPDAWVAVARTWDGRGAVARSTDGGATWSNLPFMPTGLLAVDFADDGRSGVAVGESGAAWATTDGGASWTAGATGTGGILWGVDVVTPALAFAVGDGGAILRSADGGATWTRLLSGTTDRLHAVAFTSADAGRAVGQGGAILRTVDGGATWVPELSGTSETLTAVAFTSPATGFAAGKQTMLRYTGLELPIPLAR